jgi:glutaredoxin
MVGADWCDKCQQAKGILETKGVWDMVTYIDFDGQEGKELAEKYGAKHIPFYICDGQLFTSTIGFLHLLQEISLKNAFDADVEGS